MIETVNRTGMIHRKRRPIYADHGISLLIEGFAWMETRWAGLSAGPPALVAGGDQCFLIWMVS